MTYYSTTFWVDEDLVDKYLRDNGEATPVVTTHCRQATPKVLKPKDRRYNRRECKRLLVKGKKW